MIIYKCLAKKDGEIHELKLDAVDRDDAIKQLKQLNFEKISLEEVKKSTWKILLEYLLKLRQIIRKEDGREQERVEQKIKLSLEVQERITEQAPNIPAEEKQHATTKKCPYCAEQTQYEAVKCRYCGESLSMAEQEIEKINSDKTTSGVKLKCPRCGFEAAPNEFSDAYSNSTCCCLALLMILPAVLYYFFREGKKICPKCKNVF